MKARGSASLLLVLVVLPWLGLLVPASEAAGAIEGRVVGVGDGDTITVLTSRKEQVKVRLAEIDTPESRQPYGTRARQALSDLVFSKDVRVVVVDKDRYGRTVGRVHVGGTDVNAEMVRSGAAWVYREYSSDPSLLGIEQEARSAKRGLWALPEAQRTPPWEWRRALRDEGQEGTRRPDRQEKAARQPLAGREGFSCGVKRTCGAMASCAEARFHLTECGVDGLDGNRDGVPCEGLCR